MRLMRAERRHRSLGLAAQATNRNKAAGTERPFWLLERLLLVRRNSD